LELDPELADAHNGLGVVAARRGDMEAAVGHWARAVELDRTQWDALYNLGVELTNLNRLEEAIPHLERFAREAPRTRYAEDIPGIRRLARRLREVTGTG
ncbi:MAG: tetratricopeptide repeat protein, partial [Acidobacteriota bacterium]